MVQEVGVQTFATGGRPQTGPMQPVSGTKGSLVLQSQYLTGISAYVVEEFASTRQEVRFVLVDRRRERERLRQAD